MSVIVSRQASETPVEQGAFSYGERNVTYEVLRLPLSKAERRKVNIKVHPDSRVVVTAPSNATKVQINQAVTKRARWIWNNLEEFQSQMDHVQPREYVSGESYFYLGRRYQLKVVVEADYSRSIKLLRGRFEVRLPKYMANQKGVVKTLLDNWYRVQVLRVFQERLQILSAQASWVKETPDFQIQPMKKQWGSCSRKGRLMLNPHLVKAPKECIDYVLLHELCHIAEHNHSKRFWRLLTQLMPEWKVVKAELDGMAELYLNE